jgi:hypothetical protein
MPIYMQYSGIKGESVPGLPGHGWIEINSFQWGVGRGISSPTGGSADRESSTPSVGEIVVTKPTDDAVSPRFLAEVLEALGNTKKKRDVSIVFTNVVPGGPRHTLNLREAVITGIQPHYPHRSGTGEFTRCENLTIAFSEYHFSGLPNIPIPHARVHSPGI